MSVVDNLNIGENAFCKLFVQKKTTTIFNTFFLEGTVLITYLTPTNRPIVIVLSNYISLFSVLDRPPSQMSYLDQFLKEAPTERHYDNVPSINNEQKVWNCLYKLSNLCCE